MQRGDLGPRVDAQSGGQRTAQPHEHCQRIGHPTLTGQRPHQLQVRGLVERFCRTKVFRQDSGGRVIAGGEQHADAGAVELLSQRGGAGDQLAGDSAHLVAEIVTGHPAPQPVRRCQIGGVPRGHEFARDIEVGAASCQPVTAGHRLQPALPQRRPQPGDLRMQRGRRRSRPILTPHVVDEPLSRTDPAARQRQ